MQAPFWLLGLLACNGVRKEGPYGDDSGGAFTLEADALLDLPFSSAGADPPEGELELREVGGGDGAERMSFEVAGDFSVSGDLAPLGAWEARRLTVRFTGDASAPALAEGTLSVTADGQTVTVELYAVVGDPALPEASWEEVEGGLRAVVPLPSAPYPYEDAPYDDASVLIFAPDALSDQGELGVVTHLHGHRAVLAEVVAEQRLVEQHALSGRDAVLIAPQGPYDASSGDFGRLMAEGGHAALVRDAVSVLYRDGLIRRPSLGAQVLTAHSGGYLCTAAILEGGGLAIDGVHLFDALYGKARTYEDFALGGGLLRSVWTATGGTDDDNQELAADLEAAGLGVSTTFDDDSLAESELSIGPSDSTHEGVLTESRAYARWLAQSGLPRSPYAPPELLSAISDGAETVVRWRLDRAPRSPTIRVEGSLDGETWETLAQIDEATGPGVGSATVEPRPLIRLRQLHPELGSSEPSDVYGGTGAGWLVVDGFDRVLDGSWTAPTHDFAARAGAALGSGFSVASNEAVIRGDVALGDYAGVLWLLGDESSADTTFDASERALLDAYVAAGGSLIVSGSELGYATDASWLASTLHATWVADDAGTTVAGAYTFGTVYEEDYPDVLAGETTIWSYDTGGAAAVGWGGQVVAVGFALETMDDATLAAALAELLAWLAAY